MTLAKLSPASLNTKKLAVIVLCALGITLAACQGIDYKTRDKVVDVGPVHVSADRTHTIGPLPILGGLILLGGAILLFARGRRT